MTESTPANAGAAVADQAGVIASIACAIHCAAMPLVIGYLPLLGLGWLANESFHQVMAGVCFLLAVAAFVPGWRKHRSLSPVLMGTLGVSLLTVAAFAFECDCCDARGEAAIARAAGSSTDATDAETTACTDAGCPHCQSSESSAEPSSPPQNNSLLAQATPLVTPMGGLLLIAGHLVNHRKSCQCACCGPECG